MRTGCISQQRQRHETSVDGAIARFAVNIAVEDGDGTCAAIAFRAAFLGAGQAAGAEEFEQGRVGRNVFEGDETAVQYKF